MGVCRVSFFRKELFKSADQKLQPVLRTLIPTFGGNNEEKIFRDRVCQLLFIHGEARVETQANLRKLRAILRPHRIARARAKQQRTRKTARGFVYRPMLARN